MSLRLTERLGVARPLIQAPMAGSTDEIIAIEVAKAGGLGSLPCAMLRPDEINGQVAAFRAAVTAPINLNFFCHADIADDAPARVAWAARLALYFADFDSVPAPGPIGARRPFGEAMCALVESLRPEVVSFHFGMPSPGLVDRVRATGAVVVSSATSVDEAVWLEAHGCDVIIAQGAEAGGHRGVFLQHDLHVAAATQVGTMALVPQIVDAVGVPVVAAGGIGDARGVAAAFVLGAEAVQIGTAFLRCPESKTAVRHRAALSDAARQQTALTNVFTGRPARSLVNRAVAELGPMSPDAPAFPWAAGPIAPLRAAAEAQGSGEFSPLWAGQAFVLATAAPAQTVVRELLDGARAILAKTITI